MLNEKRFILKALAAWALLVIGMSIIFTFSRGGFLALCVVGVLSLFWRRPPVLAILVGILVIVLAIPFLPNSYVERIQTMANLFTGSEVDIKSEVSFRGRASEMAVAWMMLRDHPITGVGVGNYNTQYLSYSRQLGLDPRNQQRAAHNLYLEVAAEQGLVGLTILAFILYSLFAGLYRASKYFERSQLAVYGDMAQALLVAMAGYFTASLFLHNIFPYYLWMLIGISMAVAHISEIELRDFQILASRIFTEGKRA
jgi:O-antigen ligase